MARGACRLRCPGTAGTSARFTDMKRHISYSADDARREIVDAMKRADDLGRAIAAQIADAERFSIPLAQVSPHDVAEEAIEGMLAGKRTVVPGTTHAPVP